MRLFIGVCCSILLSTCAARPATTRAEVVAPVLPPSAPYALRADEPHFKALTQLTFSGENAEAYFSFDGQKLSLQARRTDEGCDRIYTMAAFEPGPGGLHVVSHPNPVLVSSGKGATTCSHFLPGGNELIYASTHLAGEACPPRPDMRSGYVWAIYDSYDIFKTKADGTGLTQLTQTKGYDAEGTVCAKDGSIIFTSVRDGDIELYRMNSDGSNVKRLTFTPGYDGGAFFNHDCSKIVWRASRPTGADLFEYQTLLGKGLVKPTKLELYVANADGSDARQVTYLNAASFAPFWWPNRNRIIFSSNVGDPKGRDFDLWAIDDDGTHLERITNAPGFDGFPMFTPDGKYLAFSSNRATAPDKRDTNLFIAEWVDEVQAAPLPQTAAAERINADVRALADPALEGRGLGTEGLNKAGALLAERMASLGLRPLGDNGGYQVPFKAVTGLSVGPSTTLRIGATAAAASDVVPLGFSARAKIAANAVLAGYGIDEPSLGVNDYQGLDVKGKIVVVRRFVPAAATLNTPELQRTLGDLRKKAFVAKNKGAVGLVVVDWPAPTTNEQGAPEPLPREAALPSLRYESAGDCGIPVLAVKRAVLEKVWPGLQKKETVKLSMQVDLVAQQTAAFNVVGLIEAGGPKTQGPIVIGAHYDHLGFGGPDSLAPEKHEPHVGADDNASGTATVLEVARMLMAMRSQLNRDVVVALFSGEEAGILGSTALVATKPQWLEKTALMLNLDMVGRLRENTLTVLGVETAPELRALVDEACSSARVMCAASGDGYGPSDHTAFYSAGAPVLHFFTGAHSDYHKPSDTADKLNAAGAARVADVVTAVVLKAQATPLTYTKVPTPVHGDSRSFNASLGTVPDYAGPPNHQPGVLLADVRTGGGAALGGMKRGDIIVKVGRFEVRSVEDLMYVLQQAHPLETVTAVVLREGKEVSLEVTFQEGRRH